MRNAGLAIVFTDSRKKDVIGKSSSIGKFPEGTVLASNSCSMMPTNTDIKFFTTSTPYSPDTKDRFFEVKEEMRREFNIKELPYREKYFFESRFLSLINDNNVKYFKKGCGVLFSFFRHVSKLPIKEMIKVSKNISKHLSIYYREEYKQRFVDCENELKEQHRYFAEQGRDVEAEEASATINDYRQLRISSINDALIEVTNFNIDLGQRGW